MSLFNPSYTTATALVKTQDNTFDFSTCVPYNKNFGQLERLIPNLKNSNQLGGIFNNNSSYIFVVLYKSNNGEFFTPYINSESQGFSNNLDGSKIDQQRFLFYDDFVFYTKGEDKTFYLFQVSNNESESKTITIESSETTSINTILTDNKDNIYFGINGKNILYSISLENIKTLTNTLPFGALFETNIEYADDKIIFNPIIENSYYYTKGDNKFYKSGEVEHVFDTTGGSNLFAYNDIGLFYKSDKIQIVDLVNKTLSRLSYDLTLTSGTTLTSLMMNDKYISYVDSNGVNMFSPLPYSLFEEISYIPIIDKTIDNNKVIHSIDENLAYLKEDIADKGISVDMRDTNEEIKKLGILSGEEEASTTRASITTLNKNINQLRKLDSDTGNDASLTTLNENIKRLIDLLTFTYGEGAQKQTISAATLLYSLVQSNIIPHSAF